MSGLVLLLLAAGASAYGAWAALRCRPPVVAAAVGALLFAVAGVASVLASWVLGDGVVLPGRQLSPGLVAYYLSEAGSERLPPFGRALILLGPLGHLLLVVVRRDRAALLGPLPATAILLWLFAGVGASERTKVLQARGPERVAYLTIASRDGGARLILAAGDPFDSFLRVLHVQDTAGTIPELHLHWTRDGEGLVVRLHEEKDPAFAVDLDGNVTGMLPAEAREWIPPGEFVPSDVGTRITRSRVDVFNFIRRHDGLAPP